MSQSESESAVATSGGIESKSEPESESLAESEPESESAGAISGGSESKSESCKPYSSICFKPKEA